MAYYKAKRIQNAMARIDNANAIGRRMDAMYATRQRITKAFNAGGCRSGELLRVFHRLCEIQCDYRLATIFKDKSDKIIVH